MLVAWFSLAMSASLQGKKQQTFEFEPVHPIDYPTFIRVLSLDAVCPVTHMSHHGDKLIFVMLGKFSNFRRLTARPDKTAIATANILLGISLCHRLATQLLLDQVANFLPKVGSEVQRHPSRQDRYYFE